MEYIGDIINQVINNFDWAYVVSVNILTYMIIKFLDWYNGTKPVSPVLKKIILIGCVIVLACAYKVLGDTDNKILLNSAILAPVSWDFILRPIIKKIGFGYRDKDEDKDSSEINSL